MISIFKKSKNSLNKLMKNFLYVFLIMFSASSVVKAEVFIGEIKCEDPVYSMIELSFKNYHDPGFVLRSFAQIDSLDDTQIKSFFNEHVEIFPTQDNPIPVELRQALDDKSEYYHSLDNQYAGCVVDVYIFDTISEYDLGNLKDFIDQSHAQIFIQAHLLSNGGSVVDGIEIGKLFREKYAISWVGLNDYEVENLRQLEINLGRILEYRSWLSKNSELEGTENYIKVRSALDDLTGAYSSYSDSLSESDLLKIRRLIVLGEQGQGCYSACLFLYVGAIARFITPYSDLGVHQTFLDDDTLASLSVEESIGQIRNANILISEYFDSLGVPDDILNLALSVAKDDLLILSDMRQLSKMLPFVQSEYLAVIPAKKEQALVDSFIVAESIAGSNNANPSLDEVLRSLSDYRDRHGDQAMWLIFNDYYLSRAAWDQQYWREN